MKKIFIALILLFTVCELNAQAITDTAVLRTKINEWIIPNGVITATKMNTLLNGFSNVLSIGGGSWSLTGSRGTTFAAGNFAGTTDNNGWWWRTNNYYAGGIDSLGNFFVGRGTRDNTLGYDTSLIFYKQKAAIRAGRRDGSQWDNSNIGNYSSSFGYNNIANGTASIANGRDNNVQHNNAVAEGIGNYIDGAQGVAIGSYNSVSHASGVAIGQSNSVSGFYYNGVAIGSFDTVTSWISHALGSYLKMSDYGGTAVGVANSRVSGASFNSMNSANRAFQVGIGNPAIYSSYKNGFEVLFSGKGIFNQYGNGLFTSGTPTYYSVFDASGNIMEVPYVAPSGGDMTLSGVQTVTGAKTFNDTKLLLRNVANTFNGSFLNNNTANRVYTLPDRTGTLVDNTDLALKANLAGGNTLTGLQTVNGTVNINTTTGTLTLPRLNTTQQNALVGMVAGDVIWNVDTIGVVVYNGTAWLKQTNVSTVTGPLLLYTPTTSILSHRQVAFDSLTRLVALTGFSAGAGTVTSSDNILQAFNKVVGNFNTISSGAANLAYMTPNGSSGASGLRAIVKEDLPLDNFQRQLDYRASKMVMYYNEFFTTSSTDGLLMGSLGTGSAVNTAVASDANHPGLVGFNSGTTATGYTYGKSNTLGVLFGGGTWVYETLINLTTLSTGTERYQFLAGFADQTQGFADQTDAAYILYDEGGVSAGSAASANWQYVTSNNGTRTLTTSSIAVTAATWHKLRIEMNAAGTSVQFFVDGVSLGTPITTNIPTATGRETGFGMELIKSIGTTNRSYNMDYISVQNILTTSR